MSCRSGIRSLQLKIVVSAEFNQEKQKHNGNSNLRKSYSLWARQDEKLTWVPRLGCYCRRLVSFRGNFIFRVQLFSPGEIQPNTIPTSSNLGEACSISWWCSVVLLSHNVGGSETSHVFTKAYQSGHGSASPRMCCCPSMWKSPEMLEWGWHQKAIYHKAHQRNIPDQVTRALEPQGKESRVWQHVALLELELFPVHLLSSIQTDFEISSFNHVDAGLDCSGLQQNASCK